MLSKLFATASLLLSLSISVFGQGAEAVLTGTVTDPNGEAIPAVKVIAHNAATGVATNAVSNSVGIYLFPALPPGEYQLTVERTGFQKLIRSGVLLEVGAKLNLDLALTIGNTSETVEVKSAPADTQLGYLTSSVGNVITGRKILELPLVGRNAFDFIQLQAGVEGGGNNFNGTRSASLNITLDGINTQDNYFNGLGATTVANTINVDRIEEFRVVTSPADVEFGRGAGQVIMVSRQGGNLFHGSLFHEHRNTWLNSNTFFNNLRGTPREILLRNQYGGRIGGPLFLPRFGEGGKAVYDGRNKTFFHFHFEGLQQRQSNTVTSVVYTETARQGIFRYFPGVQNGNANAVVPTVDLNGNPARPAAATGPLTNLNVLSRDPRYSVLDPTGSFSRFVASTPLPNDFRVGDGLNNAGFTWNRPVKIYFSQWDLRLDHNFNPNHRAAFSFAHQSGGSTNVVGAQPFPTVPPGEGPYDTNFGGLTLTSVLRSNLINEFRVGFNRPRARTISPFDIDNSFLGRTLAGQPFIVHTFAVTPPFAETNFGSESTYRITPVYQIGDSATWVKGRHAFKGGFEARFISTTQFDAFAAMPRALLFGEGASAAVNFNNVPGLVGANVGLAQAMAHERAGQIGLYYQTLNSPGPGHDYELGAPRFRHWRSPEYSAFFKDDWKIRPSLTLNLGLRYEWLSVPVEADGRGLDWVGGGADGAFGISGNSFDALFKPGAGNVNNLARWEPIGPGTANPDRRLWNQDKNNFAPGIGLSWSLPWFGKDKTVLRGGYQLTYERNQLFLVNSMIFGVSGYSSTRVVRDQTTFLLRDYKLPLTPASPVLQPVPLTDRGAPAYAFDPSMRTPYYSNWNIGVQRALTKDTVFEVRYVGTKGSKLVRSVNVNEVNIFENGILDAFRTTQSGGNAPLFDQIFKDVNFFGLIVGRAAPGFGTGPGGIWTGSDYVRGSQPALLANNNPAEVARLLGVAGLNGGLPGSLLRNAGLPENFVLVNPQFTTMFFITNQGNSSYHSLQAEIVKRFAQGWTFQANYTWSKALGDNEGDEAGYRGFNRTLRNIGLDRRRLSFDRSHVARMNGIWELPFGPGKRFAKRGGLIGHLLGGWQIGGIGIISTGSPINLTAVNAFNAQTAEGAGVTGPVISTPALVGSLSPGLGRVQRIDNGVVYINIIPTASGDFRSVPDPSRNSITARSPFAPFPLISSQSTMRAITDASGNMILVNPLPGQFGNLQQNYLTGPGFWRLDMNLLKRFRITERVAFTFRADAFNITNTPRFGNPNTNINDQNGFGRITTTIGDARVITIGGRIEF